MAPPGCQLIVKDQQMLAKPRTSRVFSLRPGEIWAFYKDIVKLPAWNAKEGMCWKCHADKATFKLPGLDAPWRCTRYMPGECMATVRHQGLAPCPLFSIPGFTSELILVNWLHTADIGIAGDVVGNMFNEVAKLLPGRNKEERVKVLWGKVRLYYKASHTPNKLQTLTPAMIKANGKPPKHRAQAAITRHLVPCAAFIAQGDVPCYSPLGHCCQLCRALG